ncbi:hypothetical protein [Paenibacillus sp. FSL K6-2859]|uniref:hypothetical protein n=1 Tax=Paenibacillus sp. FSL K6-2859 TaxID=2921482 RepID=UPI0030F5117F
MPTELYAIIRKSTGALAWKRAVYADAGGAKQAARRACGNWIKDYAIVRVAGSVTLAWDTDAAGNWVNVEKTEVSAPTVSVTDSLYGNKRYLNVGDKCVITVSPAQTFTVEVA